MLRWLSALLAVVLLGAWIGIDYALGLLEPAAQEPRQTLFVVERGASLGSVTRRLEAAGLIRSALAAELAARFDGIEGRLQVGEYELSPHESARRILEIITTGRVVTYAVTVPEGSRAVEIAQRLEDAGLVDAAAFLDVVRDPEFVRSLAIDGDSLEGYLYPDTYHLPRNLGPEELARIMVRQFETVWRDEIEELARRRGLTRSEVVTLASIVEKETAAPEERPLIAAVFLNRLKKRMRLETDPTVIYGIPNFDGNLRKRDLLDASNPYNTYRIAGLPPGPIASPGVEALRAVVSPSETDDLYFVSRNDGTHFFSSNYREHTNAVNRFQKRRRRR